MIIGHVAISLLEHRYLDAELTPVVVGGLFPDIVDKTLCYVLHVTPSGRMYAHTALGLAASTLFAWLLGNKRTARGWALGYAGHLLADGADTLPWWFPFRGYTFRPSPKIDEILKRFFENRGELVLEAVLLGWAVLALLARSSRSDRAAGIREA